jgi:uncharacterized protein YceK
MRAVAFSLIPFLACAACGCGTMSNLIGAGTPPADASVNVGPPNVVYGGVKQDAEYAWEQLHPYAVAASFSGAPGGPLMPFLGLCAVVDLPLSAIGDTITLPITIPATIERRSELQHSSTPILRAEHTTDSTTK